MNSFKEFVIKCFIQEGTKQNALPKEDKKKGKMSLNQ